MTDKTATQNLTRTQGSDDPRQVAAYLQQLAIDIDLRMASQFFDLNRSINPPFCCARMTIAQQIDSTVTPPGGSYVGQVPFDTAEIDTAGMIDLSADPYTIVLPEPGYYWLGGYALANGFGAAAADFYATVHANSFNFNDPRHDASSGLIGSSPNSVIRVPTVPAARPPALTVGFTGSGGPATTVFFAELWVMKVRDL